MRPAFGVVLALGTDQVALHRFRLFDQGQQALVGIRDDQPRAIQPALFEVAQELAPEALSLAVAHGDPEHLAVAQGISAQRRGLAALQPSILHSWGAQAEWLVSGNALHGSTEMKQIC